MITSTDVYQRVTDQIVAALEAGVAGKWKQPWGAASGMPINAVTGLGYRGINVPLLWAAASGRGYGTAVWATYKQWSALGAQVRRGETATTIVFFKPLRIEDRATGEEKTIPMAKAFSVFNAAQVDGYAGRASVQLSDAERDAAAESFFAAIGAKQAVGNRACYMPAIDTVVMPAFGTFRDAVSYYATLAHELVHWTGHAVRCNRVFGSRFGDEAYAVEELVAELGAAFACATLGFSAEPREDHVQYLASWLRVLKADKRAIFTAAAAAQKAFDHLAGCAGEQEQEAEAA